MTIERDPAFPSSVAPTPSVSDVEVAYAYRRFKELSADPAVENWARAEAKQQAEIRTPLELLGFHRGYLAGLFKGVVAPDTIESWGDPPEGDEGHTKARGWFMSAATVLEGAMPFLWLPEMYMLATESGLPEHVIAPFELPHRAMAWWFSRPAGSRERLGLPSTTVYGLLLTALDDDRRLVVVELGTAPGPGPTSARTFRFDIRAGQRYGVDFGERSQEAEVLQMLSFLRSRYVEAERQRVRPDQLKRLRRRAGRPVELPDIMVIKLRGPEPAAPTRSERAARQWSHRWMVRGHHRAQWYPTLGAHKVVWIAPHFKGPANKPLKAQIYAVVR